MENNSILSANIQSFNRVELMFESKPVHPVIGDFIIDNGIVVSRFQLRNRMIHLETSPMDPAKLYQIIVRGAGQRLLMHDGILDLFYSDKSLGCRFDGVNTAFRLFAPRAARVHLVLFEKFTDRDGMELPMSKDRDGVWEILLKENCSGKYYGYRVWGPKHPTELFNPDVIVADPYSEAVVTRNHFLHPAKSIILPPSSFDWEGDAWVCPDLEDLVIYEMHVRDMTVHPTSGISPDKKGTYSGLTERGKTGGLDYLLSLGINAVELLPVQEFGNIEPDYRNPSLSVYNDWNPYARNHWGYMTSCFFTPESFYAAGNGLAPGEYCGTDGRQVDEFKQMVKLFHRAGLAVLMDVVYNHVSQYDFNPFKYIDKKYYFRLDAGQDFVRSSGCGNDFKTERPMARRLITDSILHWMREYHVDGFRFDLASMIDDRTLDEITAKARALNPRVVLIAEPWGGGKYGQAGFSRRGWASWNDWFRNGVKGENPKDGRGFLFGKWLGSNSPAAMRKYVRGTLQTDNGPFIRSGHSVNYLESHDGYTFGDFVRIAAGRVREDQSIEDEAANAALTEAELKIHKLGALFLFTGQGAVMLHEGQEFARSKVIAKTDFTDPWSGRLDPNSYNKDNETNWIDYTHARLNPDLMDYYRGMIALRKRIPIFRRATCEAFHFLECANPFGIGYVLQPDRFKTGERMAVLMNGHPFLEAFFNLPGKEWGILADGNRAGTEVLHSVRAGSIRIPPTSGMVLIQSENS